jgi:hypothetical protein
VLIGDGWVKDGDYNTSFSRTVGPLPRHARPDDEALSSSRTRKDDSLHRHDEEDWQTFHTRFVTPDRFLSGLRHE